MTQNSATQSSVGWNPGQCAVTRSFCNGYLVKSQLFHDQLELGKRESFLLCLVCFLSSHQTSVPETLLTAIVRMSRWIRRGVQGIQEKVWLWSMHNMDARQHTAAFHHLWVMLQYWWLADLGIGASRFSLVVQKLLPGQSHYENMLSVGQPCWNNQFWPQSKALHEKYKKNHFT